MRDTGQLHVRAPLGAGWAALASFPAVILALGATRHFGARGVYLPPVTDARFQLWCIAIAVVGGVVAVDCRLGLGTCLKALAADGLSAGVIALTIALAVSSPLMIFWTVESRPAWLWELAAQFSWPFIGILLGHAISARRKARLSPPRPLPSPTAWLAEYGVDANQDVILVSPGSRKTLVIKAIRILTGMGLREAKDLVGDAPGLVMHGATSDQVDRARELLESAGATVTVADATALDRESP